MRSPWSVPHSQNDTQLGAVNLLTGTKHTTVATPKASAYMLAPVESGVLSKKQWMGEEG